MTLSLGRLLTLSRPRFWLYELGTFALGVFMAAPYTGQWTYGLIAVFALYFLFPANLLIYGVNDVYDYETDMRNPKKAGYEAVLPRALHHNVLRVAALSTAPFLLLAFVLPPATIVAFLAFVFFAVFYSMPPIRAKARPVLDSFFSAGHYVATGVFGYYLAGGLGDVTLHVVAGMLWAMAMHAYSAVPDIAADTEAGVPTVATLLGTQRTIILCGLAYVAAGLIVALLVGFWSLILCVPYLVMMVRSYRTSDAHLLTLYAYFPYLNAVVGMILCFVVFYFQGWLF